MPLLTATSTFRCYLHRLHTNNNTKKQPIMYRRFTKSCSWQKTTVEDVRQWTLPRAQGLVEHWAVLAVDHHTCAGQSSHLTSSQFGRGLPASHLQQPATPLHYHHVWQFTLINAPVTRLKCVMHATQHHCRVLSDRWTTHNIVITLPCPTTRLL